LLDVLSLCADLGRDKSTGFIFGNDFFTTRRSGWRSVCGPTVGCDPAFAPLLQKSLQIRLSDRAPFEKGKQIAKLVKPWMTREQIHALFGESQAVIWDPAEACVTYVDYAVCVDRYNRAVCRDDEEQAKDVWWDYLTPCPWRAPISNRLYPGCAIWF